MTDKSLQLFEQAWQLAEAVRELPAEERATRIETACGNNAELFDKVQALLATPTSAVLMTGGAQSLAGDALEATARDLIDDFSPGDQVGTYRLVKELGVGGMSRVYLAVREGVEFEQHVAVKLMRAFSTAQADSRARFEREQQVLASLSHPHIASIIDGGVTPSDRPFLVMEYVAGQTITEYCQRHQPDLEARLNLFVDVCAAVDHAHRGLVVHRDLKPSNILVDKEGQVKLLDFGIAKLLDETGSADLTRTGLMMMTPQYAAPEQVTGSRITMSTDVYALGLILYEVLTDKRAWEAEGLSISEQLLHICEKDPTPPSTANPATPWSSSLRGDLDLIVAKALSKTPAERYPSCADLVRDLEFWRRGEPVSAHAPSSFYRLQKFTRRHWMGVLGTLTSVGIVGFFIVTLLQQQESIRLERDRAQDAQAATGAVNRFLIDELLGATSSDAAYGRDVPVSLMLERAEATAGRAFAGQPALEASVRETLSRTFMRLGDLERATKNLELAQNRLSDYASNSPADLNRLELVKIELQIAQGDAQGASDAANALLGRQPTSTETLEIDLIAALVLLARAQVKLDNLPQAQENLSIAIAALERDYPDRWRLRSQAQLDLVKVLYEQREPAPALALLQKRLALQTRFLGENHPDILTTLQWQSSVLSRLENEQESLKVAELAYSLAQRVFGELHPEAANAANTLARIYVRVQRYDESVTLFEQTYNSKRVVHGEDHPDTLMAQQNLGVALSYAGRLNEAESVKREAFIGFKNLYGERNSSTIRALKNLSNTLQDRGKTEEHREVVQQLVGIAKSFENDDEADPIRLNDAADLLLTCEPADLRDPVSALAIATQAVDRTGGQKGETLITLGDALVANGYADKAIETYEKAAEDNGVLHIHSLLRNLSLLYLQTDQIERAEQFFARHLERRRAARGDEDWLLGLTLHELGRFYVNAQLGEKAIPTLNNAIKQYRLTREDNDALIMRSQAALGAAQSQAGQFETAERNMLSAYNALLTNRQVTSHIKREIIEWLIAHYLTLEQSDNVTTWETELAARQEEPLFSDWTRRK
ncbi:MAG: tetratricopeptide repeat protein [Gammaproteobacteria bacterium]